MGGDIETNGLLHEPHLSTIWCICTEDGEFGPDQIDDGLKHLSEQPTLIFHNGIGFDFPALAALKGYRYDGEVIDTLILSQLLYPERPGGHSLKAWGERLGFHKVEHEDWTQFSPEMLHRCKVDAQLTKSVYEVLCEEVGQEIRGIHLNEYSISLRE